MADDLVEWWLRGARPYDRRLRNEVESLDDGLFESPKDSGGAGRPLNELQGTLTSRVDRLAAAVDALVELADVRAELAAYTPAAMARLAARRRLSRLARRSRRPPGPPPPVAGPGERVEDVPGYWLPPALTALDELLAGRDGGGAREEALRRDAVRATLFWALALSSARPASLPALDPVLPDGATDQVARAGRLAWIAAAEGRFGTEGRVRLGSRLDALVGQLDHEVADANRRSWAESIFTLTLPSPVEIAAPLTTDDAAPLVAAARLEVLASWCSPGPPAPAGDGPPATDDHDADDSPTHELPRMAPPRAIQAGAPRAPSETDSSVSLLYAPPPPRRPPSLPPVADPLTELLRFLVEEGSPPEAELARQELHLRGLARGERPEQVASLDDPVGELTELLYRDAFGTADAQRSLALWVGRSWVAEGVADLVAAAQTPPASTVTVRVDDAELRIREEAPRPDEVRVAAQMATVRSRPSSGSHNPITRRREDHERGDYERDLERRLHAAAQRAAGVLAEHRARCGQAAKAALASRDAIHRALGL